MADKRVNLTKTEKNLWNAIVSEAMALMKYNAYAYKALEEGHPEIAQVFQEVAGAEQIHGINHMRVAGEIDSSIENLKSVIQGEAQEIASKYPKMIKEAIDDGRLDAAETFTMALEREKHHLGVFQEALRELEYRYSQEPSGNLGEFPKSVSPTNKVHTEAILPLYDEARREMETQPGRIAAMGRIREVVFGAQDGLISTVALVTSIAVADLGNTTVVIAGLAGALAGTISMATGAYLGSRAQKDVQQYEIEKEAWEIDNNPAEELAELVVLYQREGLTFEEAKELSEHISSDRDLWLRTMIEKELGLSPKMTSDPIKDAATMGMAFIVGAIIPIIPYFMADGITALSISIPSALLGLFLLGMGKGRVVRKSPILQGLEVMTIGGISAAIGFGLGECIPLILS